MSWIRSLESVFSPFSETQYFRYLYPVIQYQYHTANSISGTAIGTSHISEACSHLFYTQKFCPLKKCASGDAYVFREGMLVLTLWPVQNWNKQIVKDNNYETAHNEARSHLPTWLACVKAFCWNPKSQLWVPSYLGKCVCVNPLI